MAKMWTFSRQGGGGGYDSSDPPGYGPGERTARGPTVTRHHLSRAGLSLRQPVETFER